VTTKIQAEILTGEEYASLFDNRRMGNKYHSIGLWMRDTKKEHRAESYEGLSMLDKIAISLMYKKLNLKLIT